MRKGTVTIWVNRGIRIDQGIGTPDRGIGSGFFVDPRGFLLTNYHVVSSEVDPEYEGYSRLYIRLPGQTSDRIPARVVGWDKVMDLALIKVDLEPPYVFSFTGRREFQPGDRIYAIGSPVGLDNTLTAGIVSAVGRRFLPLGEVIQVDAAVNPGNSGGPLLDSEGELAGVVFAGLPRYQGLNFAVPATWAVRLMPDLFRGGEVRHPWMGIAAYEGRDGLSAIYRHPDGSPCCARRGGPGESGGQGVQDPVGSPGGASFLRPRDSRARGHAVRRARRADPGSSFGHGPIPPGRPRYAGTCGSGCLPRSSVFMSAPRERTPTWSNASFREPSRTRRAFRSGIPSSSRTSC
ncbi:MAG: trypsin-like peptidase domain-containing protein [Candidatus Moduliflexus flocculans]|nr:trypsin-like peptidase domain-containing protein [Candidatus Moduliflexus flocculans]